MAINRAVNIKWIGKYMFFVRPHIKNRKKKWVLVAAKKRGKELIFPTYQPRALTHSSTPEPRAVNMDYCVTIGLFRGWNQEKMCTL